MLQGRLFAYADTQMYRLGANYNHLPINRPLVPVNNNNQDGKMNYGHRKGEANYEPSTSGEISQQAKYKWGNRSLVCCTVRSTRHDSGARRTRRERQPRRCARRDCAANGHRATQHLCGERTAPCGCVTVNSRTCLVAPRVDQCQRIEQGSLCLSHRHDWLCPCPSRCGNWFMPSMAGTLE